MLWLIISSLQTWLALSEIEKRIFFRRMRDESILQNRKKWDHHMLRDFAAYTYYESLVWEKIEVIFTEIMPS